MRSEVGVRTWPFSKFSNRLALVKAQHVLSKVAVEDPTEDSDADGYWDTEAETGVTNCPAFGSWRMDGSMHPAKAEAKENVEGHEWQATGAVRSMDNALSHGSILHGTGECKPCTWHFTQRGCFRGKNCAHCHECPRGARKQRSRQKVIMLKAAGVFRISGSNESSQIPDSYGVEFAGGADANAGELSDSENHQLGGWTEEPFQAMEEQAIFEVISTGAVSCEKIRSCYGHHSPATVPCFKLDAGDSSQDENENAGTAPLNSTSASRGSRQTKGSASPLVSAIATPPIRNASPTSSYNMAAYRGSVFADDVDSDNAISCTNLRAFRRSGAQSGPPLALKLQRSPSPTRSTCLRSALHNPTDISGLGSKSVSLHSRVTVVGSTDDGSGTMVPERIAELGVRVKNTFIELCDDDDSDEHKEWTASSSVSAPVNMFRRHCDRSSSDEVTEDARCTVCSADLADAATAAEICSACRASDHKPHASVERLAPETNEVNSTVSTPPAAEARRETSFSPELAHAKPQSLPGRHDLPATAGTGREGAYLSLASALALPSDCSENPRPSGFNMVEPSLQTPTQTPESTSAAAAYPVQLASSSSAVDQLFISGSVTGKVALACAHLEFAGKLLEEIRLPQAAVVIDVQSELRQLQEASLGCHQQAQFSQQQPQDQHRQASPMQAPPPIPARSASSQVVALNEMLSTHASPQQEMTDQWRRLAAAKQLLQGQLHDSSRDVQQEPLLHDAGPTCSPSAHDGSQLQGRWSAPNFATCSSCGASKRSRMAPCSNCDAACLIKQLSPSRRGFL